jgi:hypothetical protein
MASEGHAAGRAAAAPASPDSVSPRPDPAAMVTDLRRRRLKRRAFALDGSARCLRDCTSPVGGVAPRGPRRRCRTRRRAAPRHGRRLPGTRQRRAGCSQAQGSADVRAWARWHRERAGVDDEEARVCGSGGVRGGGGLGRRGCRPGGLRARHSGRGYRGHALLAARRGPE